MGFTVHGWRLQRSDDRLPHPGLEVERSVHGPVLGAGALQRLHLRSLNFEILSRRNRCIRMLVLME